MTVKQQANPGYIIKASLIILLLVLFRVVFSMAQDVPSTSIKDVQPSGLPVTNAVEVSSELVITGRVHVVRDEQSYKVIEVDIIVDDGRIYKVLLDGKGRQLVRILKSRIIRVAGELKEIEGKKLLAVHNSEIIGSTKKIVAASVPRPKLAAGVKTAVSAGVATNNGITVAIAIPTNAPAVAQAVTVTNLPVSVGGSNRVVNYDVVTAVSQAEKIPESTNIVTSAGSNSVLPAVPE